MATATMGEVIEFRDNKTRPKRTLVGWVVFRYSVCGRYRVRESRPKKLPKRFYAQRRFRYAWCEHWCWENICPDHKFQAEGPAKAAIIDAARRSPEWADRIVR